LNKPGQKTETTVPTIKDEANGKPIPDPAVAAQLGELKEGDAVWADVAGAGKSASLLAILPWTDPQPGKVAKITTADVDGQTGPAIEIDEPEKTITALLPGKVQNKKWTP